MKSQICKCVSYCLVLSTATGAHPIPGGVFPPPPAASELMTKLPPPDCFVVCTWTFFYSLIQNCALTLQHCLERENLGSVRYFSYGWKLSEKWRQILDSKHDIAQRLT